MPKRYRTSSIYNELLLESSGLNINLNEQFFLSDVLRIDYDCEMRKELVKEYIKNSVPNEFSVADSESEPDSSNFVHIFPDFSALISTSFSKVAVNRVCEGYFPFFHEKPKTYCLVSIVCTLANWDGNGNIQDIFKNCIDLLTIIKLKSDIVGFLYSTSGLSARTLLHKCSEAKQLFSLESVQSSLESLNSTGYKPKSRHSLSEDSESKASEISESFEYSATSMSYQSINEDFISFNTLVTEENKAGINNELSIEYEIPEAQTPEANFKQFEMPTARLKLLFKLQETQLNSTSPFSVDSDKVPAYMNDFFQVKNPDSQTCYNCEKCVIA